MIRPTARLLRYATAALVLSVASLQWPWLSVTVAIVLVAGLAGDLAGLDTWRPLVAVETPSRVGVGQAFHATVGAMPRGKWFRARIRLETDEGLEAGSDVVASQVAGRGAHRFFVELTARRRGEGEIRAVWVQVEGPVGLFASVHRICVRGHVRVSPNLATVRQLSAVVTSRGAHTGSMPVASSGAGTEFDELRPYSAGMDSRSIDWKSSARHRELRVRRYRQERNQQLVLVVDNHASPGGDQAVHAGLALARTALAQGDRVAMQLFGATPRAWVPFGHGARHLQKLVRTLGETAPEAEASNPVHGAHALAVRLRRRSMVVLFTEVGDPVRADLVAEAVRVLQAKHRVLVVALRDPHEEEFPRPESLQDVAQSLLRRNLDAERERAMKRLRGAGVSVLSVGPRGAVGALLQRYRASKRRIG